MNDSEYITIGQFAKMHQVPVEAVLNAIKVGKLKTLPDNQEVLQSSLISDYKFELIGAYEYAERKGVTNMAVYKRLNNEKILFTVDGAVMKIDWELFKDQVFRAPNYKFRGKNKLAS